MNDPSPKEAPMTPGRRALGAAVAGFLVAKALLFLGAAAVVLKAPDEFYQAGFPRDLGAFYHQFDPVKTVLIAVYYLPAHLLAADSVELVLFARLESALLGLAMAGLAVLVARRLGARALEAAMAGCVLFSFSTFFERAFRIRSDTLAVALGLAGFALTLGEERRTLRLLGGGFLLGAAFGSTQKAIYLAVAVGAGLVGAALLEKDWRRALREGALLVGGWAAAVLAYALAFGGTAFAQVLEQVFLSPMRIASEGGNWYDDLDRFVAQTLTRNLLPYGLCAAGWLLAGWAVVRRRESAAATAAWITTGLVTLLVFTHSQPWPYVFVMALPFLTPWAVRLLALPPRPRERTAVAALLLALLALSFGRNLRLLELDDSRQVDVMLRAEALLNPDDVYADGTGMIPTRQQAGRAWWDALETTRLVVRAREGDRSDLEALLAEQPKLWISSYRLGAAREAVEPLLARSYVPVSPNLLLSGAVLPSPAPVEFRARWSGEYELRRADGSAAGLEWLLDGQPVRGKVRLEPGAHECRLAAPAGEPLWLLPADTRHAPIDPRPAQVIFGAEVYEY